MLKCSLCEQAYYPFEGGINQNICYSCYGQIRYKQNYIDRLQQKAKRHMLVKEFKDILLENKLYPAR